jgi:hypothetical protein
MSQKRTTIKAEKYLFLSKEESDKLRAIMQSVGGYPYFRQKWIDFGKSKPIPSQNVYYNVLNGRSVTSEVMGVIKEIVDQTNLEIQDLKESLK